MTYQIPADSSDDLSIGISLNGGSWNYKTTNGATVTFQMPSHFMFAQLLDSTLSMNGDFVFSGANNSFAFQNNGGTLALTGVTIQNMIWQTGAIVLTGGEATLNSVTFSKNQGLYASAMYNNGGTVTLSSVTIQDSSVTSSAGGQIYNLGGTLSGSISGSGNTGEPYQCNGGTCTVSYSTSSASASTSAAAKNAGKIAGIVIGVIVGLGIIGGVVAFFLQKKKRKGNIQQPLNDVIVVQQGDGTAKTGYNQF